MTTVSGNIWDFHADGHWICITTNGYVKADGTCVMGRGTALQAAKKYPHLPRRLGQCIRSKGNLVYVFHDLRIISFPVKRVWNEDADMKLIVNSAKELSAAAEFWEMDEVYLPKPGCGNGRLQWSDVFPAIQEILRHKRFKVVELSV